MRTVAHMVLAAALACGGGPQFDLLGKPCAGNNDCAPAEGVLCSPIWLDGATPEYACELPAPGPRPAGGCPSGTKLWVALLTIPDATGAYRSADYCAPECMAGPTDSVGTCKWNRQCFGVCGR